MSIRYLRSTVRHKVLNVGWWKWKLQTIFSRAPLKVFHIDGLLFAYPLRSEIGYALSTVGFELSEISYIRRTLKPGNVVFDVGANAGLFTLIAAKIVGTSGHIYAFEPSSREVALLRHNVELNGLTNVTIIPMVVSDSCGPAQFAISADGAMNSLAETNHPAQRITEWQEVQSTTIDNYVNQHAIAKVDFIKIDVEGAEKLVFDGAWQVIKSQHSPTILFEAADLNAVGFAYTTSSFLGNLREKGLQIYQFDGAGDLHPIHETDERLGKDVYNFVALPSESRLGSIEC